ncbi:MAG TPA: hypothetical protein VH280_06865 [Verrucomicrobiae bacterium]|jgi:hypothetical protein|nr:hypothetical protein [Verrucomicrobiae bacterium]
MKPEKEKLFDDLLDAQSRREATLQAGAQILRRRRHWRAARQSLTVVAIAVIAGICMVQKYRPQRTVTVPAPVSVAINRSAPPESGVLTDDQLLALFPNTPVALATLHNGKKMIIFPRPADEARYVVHL